MLSILSELTRNRLPEPPDYNALREQAFEIERDEVVRRLRGQVREKEEARRARLLNLKREREQLRQLFAARRKRA